MKTFKKLSFSLICLFFLILFFYSCKTHKQEEYSDKNISESSYLTHLKKINSKLNQIPMEEWELTNKYISDNDIYYKLNRLSVQDRNLMYKDLMNSESDYTFEEGDCIESLNYYYYKSEDKIVVDSYSKSYFGNKYLYVLQMDNSDTIYYYKVDRLNYKEGKKVFIVGKYNYLYITGNLESKEEDYYILYKDSLSKVRGNNVSPLPELTEIEKIKLMHKIDHLDSLNKAKLDSLYKKE